MSILCDGEEEKQPLDLSVLQECENGHCVGFGGALRIVDPVTDEQAVVAFPAARGPGGKFDEGVGSGACFHGFAELYFAADRYAVLGKLCL